MEPSRRQEFETKWGRIRGYLDARKIDGVFLSRCDTFSWLTAGAENRVAIHAESGPSTLAVTRESVSCIAPVHEAPRLGAEALEGLPVEVRSLPWEDAGAKPRLLREIAGTGRWEADDASLGFPAAVSAELAGLRYGLLPPEIKRYEALGREAARIVEDALRAVYPGETEHQIAGSVGGELLAGGITPVTLLVAAEERIAAHRHPLPTGRRFKARLLVSVCARRSGLIVSLTRQVASPPLTPEERTAADGVRRVLGALWRASRPGATGDGLFRSAREAYREAGFPDVWTAHHQGGPTGYQSRDWRIAPGEQRALVAGQAVAYNPTIGSFKAEETAVMTEGGIRILTPPRYWPAAKAERHRVAGILVR